MQIAEASAILSQAGIRADVQQVSTVSGGCINDCFRIQSDKQSWFIKIRASGQCPGMFEAETAGLQCLAETGIFRIPRVTGRGSSNGKDWLLLEWILSSSPSRSFWPEFGQKLRALHQNHQDLFGLNQANYIGSLRQDNTPSASWFDFFRERRLLPQWKIARDHGLISGGEKDFQHFIANIENRVPECRPSLLHGDLWSGNYMIDEKGNAALVDPAVYYGHPETDLAMTRLFGGFHADFYKAYVAAANLDNDWEKRTDIFNLYPILVHVNLFGGSYRARALNILRRLA